MFCSRFVEENLEKLKNFDNGGESKPGVLACGFLLGACCSLAASSVTGVSDTGATFPRGEGLGKDEVSTDKTSPVPSPLGKVSPTKGR